MRLLPSEKVAILEEAETLFLDAKSIHFDWNEVNPNMISIEYVGIETERFYFNIIDNTTEYGVITIPEISKSKRTFNIAPEFRGLFSLIKPWLEAVRREVSAQVRYNELLNPRSYIDFEEFESKETRFTKEEYETLEKQKLLLFNHLETLQIEQEKLEELKSEVDESVKKAKGYTKADFKKHLIGALIVTFFRIALNQDTINLVWQSINHFIFNDFLLPLP